MNTFCEDWLIQKNVLDSFNNWLSTGQNLSNEAKGKEEVVNKISECRQRKINIQSFLYEELDKLFIAAFFEKSKKFKNWKDFTQCEHNINNSIIQMLRQCDENCS